MTIPNALLVAALVCFLIQTWAVQTRWNLLALGNALCVLSVLIQRLRME